MLKIFKNVTIQYIDIVLQGPATEYTIEIATYYSELPFVNRIIVSCWETCSFEYTLNPKIIVVRNKPITEGGFSNINRQICTSYNGIKHVTAKFCIKMRSDQKYSHDGLTQMHTFYIKNDKKLISFQDNPSKPLNRICVSGIFPNLLFHPADHVYFGNKLDLLDLFNIPYSNPGEYPLDINRNIRAETYIGSYYCSNFLPVIKKFIENPNDYLVDNAPLIEEARKTSRITSLVFLPFPRIPFDWPRHYDNPEGHNESSIKDGNTWS